MNCAKDGKAAVTASSGSSNLKVAGHALLTFVMQRRSDRWAFCAVRYVGDEHWREIHNERSSNIV